MGGEYMGLLETEALCSDGIQEELWSTGMLFDICLGGEDMDSSSRMGKNIYSITVHSLASSQTCNYHPIIFLNLLTTEILASYTATVGHSLL